MNPFHGFWGEVNSYIQKQVYSFFLIDVTSGYICTLGLTWKLQKYPKMLVCIGLAVILFYIYTWCWLDLKKDNSADLSSHPVVAHCVSSAETTLPHKQQTSRIFLTVNSSETGSQTKRRTPDSNTRLNKNKIHRKVWGNLFCCLYLFRPL
jgi:hypothetical protein